jgi:hypothetical protein
MINIRNLLVEGEADGLDDGPHAGGTSSQDCCSDSRRLRRWTQTTLPYHPPDWLKKQVANLSNTASDDHQAGVEQIDQVGNRNSQVTPSSGDDLLGYQVTQARSFRHVSR